LSRLRIGDHSVQHLRDHYHNYLFDEYLPFWSRHGVDHERGGFICGLDHDGTCVSDNKNMWYQGRGLWTYSYLYRNFGGEENLEIARKTKDFLLRHGRAEDGLWVTTLSKVGQVLDPPSTRGYEGLFVAEGLQAYAHATGDTQAFDLAVESLQRVLALYEEADRPGEDGYVPHSYPGMRVLGGHMVTILTLTQMLHQRPEDATLQALADTTMQAITQRFWNGNYGLMCEALAHDYSRPDDINEDFSYLGHAIETLWMAMDEAVRRRDRPLLELCADRFRRHVEIAWDDVEGGLFRALHIREHSYTLDKVLWLQEEGLIGCLLMIEHGVEADWARFWYERIFDYVEDHFRLTRHGFPLYQTSGDRHVTFTPHVTRKENYHHPRCVMRSLLVLDRLLEGDGRPAQIW
jgi:N-acylglucosamine 2-epimerase